MRKINREELVTQNMGLAYHIAKKFLNTGLEYDDLAQIACIGLVKASRSYDANNGSKFSSFAGPVIQNEILMELRKVRRINKVSVISFDNQYEDSSGNTIDHLQALDDKRNYAEETIENVFICDVLGKLTKKDRDIIKMSYGIGQDARTQRYIANIYGVTQAEVSRRLGRILKKIRKEYELCI